MNNGFYKSLSLEKYLTADGLSKSALVDLAISPAHYKARLSMPTKFDAADLGTAVHMLVLEPERAECCVFCPPANILAKNGARSGNAYKEWVDALPGGAIVLKQDEYDSARAMRDSVLAHPAAADMLRDGNPEVSAFWTCGYGVARKCRPDFLSDDYVVDLKTTVSAEPEQFGRQAYNLRYHWSACWTLDILRGLTGGGYRPYVLVAVEKEPPYAVACYQVPVLLIDDARSKIALLLAKYRACVESDHWPAYSDDIETLFVPAWVQKQMEV